MQALPKHAEPSLFTQSAPERGDAPTLRGGWSAVETVASEMPRPDEAVVVLCV